MAFSGFTLPAKPALEIRLKAQPRGGMGSGGDRTSNRDRVSPMTPVESPLGFFKRGPIISTNVMWCRCMAHRHFITY